MLRRSEHSLDDALRLRPARVPCKPGSNQGVVVGPDRSVVVRERVEAGVSRRHRPHTPPRPELVAHQLVDDRVDAVRRNDAAPEEVSDVRAERVDLALVAVERERVEAAALLDPERLVETFAQLLGLGLDAGAKLAVTPDVPSQLRHAPLRVVDVALNLAGGDRGLRKRPI